jgi:hypothetical protein
LFNHLFPVFEGCKIHLSLKSGWIDCFHFNPVTLSYSCLCLSFLPVNVTTVEMFVMTCQTHPGNGWKGLNGKHCISVVSIRTLNFVWD